MATTMRFRLRRALLSCTGWLINGGAISGIGNAGNAGIFLRPDGGRIAPLRLNLESEVLAFLSSTSRVRT